MRNLICSLLLLSWISFGISNSDSLDNSSSSDSDHTLCSSCDCFKETKRFDCSDKNLGDLFANSDWISLNKTFPLSKVTFHQNNLQAITAFPELPIIALDFSFNQIAKIEKKSFTELQQLEILDLSNNRLSSEDLTPDVFEGRYSPGAYEPLMALKTLKLSNNNLHILNPDIFEHLPSLESLSLNSNPFKVIDQGTEIAITNIAQLKFLDMSDMELTILPVHLFHAPRALQILNLTENLFTDIPEALIYAINLKELILDGNPIVTVGSNHSKFGTMPKLERLGLSYMPLLERIEHGSFSGLEHLKELRCSENGKMSYIHPEALSRPGKEESSRLEWPPLNALYLHNNNISTLESNLVGRWDSLEIIDLRHNPWLCDCTNQWMVDNLINKIESKTSTLVDDIICDSPIEMKGQKMAELENSQLRCSDLYGHRPERDGAILIGVLIGILVGIPMSLAIILIYKRGCFGLLGYRGPADYSRAFYKRAGQDDIYF